MCVCSYVCNTVVCCMSVSVCKCVAVVLLLAIGKEGSRGRRGGGRWRRLQVKPAVCQSHEERKSSSQYVCKD